MTEMTKMDAAAILRKHLEGAGSDQLREMVQMFAEALMSAEADGLCGASYGERSADRVNQRGERRIHGAGSPSVRHLRSERRRRRPRRSARTAPLEPASGSGRLGPGIGASRRCRTDPCVVATARVSA